MENPSRSESPDATEPPRSSSGRPWSFIAWTFGIGWPAAAVAWLLLPRDHPEAGVNVLAALLTAIPLIVAIILAHRWRASVRDAWALRLPNAASLLIAPLIALTLAAFATALPVLLGISEFDPSGMGEVQRLAEEHRIEALNLKLNIDEYGSPLRARIAVGLVAGMLLGLLLAPIIELPWRGLLLGELAHRGFAAAALLSAGLAALWWLPLQLWVDLAGRPTTALAAVTLLTYALLGVPLAWARLRTGSILPGSALLVTAAALSHVPALALSGGSRLQLDLCALAAVALLAGAALILSPRAEVSTTPDEEDA